MKRAPFTVSGQLARLGGVLEVECRDSVLRWDRAPMFWCGDRGVVLWLDGIDLVPTEKDPDPDARSAFEIWHDRRPHEVLAFEWPRGSWESMGAIRRIDYWSDREKKRGLEYTHATRSRMYRYGKRDRWVYAIAGQKISDRGLI